MNRLLLLALILTGCATRTTQTTSSKVGQPIQKEIPSLDKTLLLRFRIGTPSSYQLVDAVSGKNLASAESAIRPDDVLSDGTFRGSINVVFSKDSNAVCIQEDVSDAIPANRYILMRKPYDSDSPFETSYLLPEANTWTTDPVYEFKYTMPDVTGVSKDTIIFRYSGFKDNRPVWINSINSSKVPITSK